MPVQPKRLNKNEHNKTVESVTDGRQTYNILKEVGRGGFAVVFEAVNVDTNEHHAMKRFLLDSIDAESLGQIEAEIDLMKKLNHPNIVKYVDTLRTEGYLYVVLEFMENGSLQTTLRKTGKFSESVAAIYIVQILRGLKYLHEQGVLHRDIKGANILTSLDGQVKLADFGVAMKLSDAPSEDEQFVVGTPYWMAPEIIEMSTPTPACDIWSVGCTVIELLTGKPPYFDLAPMAALFRIVQDDYPPLPEGISQALRDFLLLCFQKEPTMRKGAERLLEHPWLQNTSNAAVHTSDLLPSKDGIPDEVVVNTIRKFQLDMKTKPTKKTGQPTSTKSPASGNKTGRNDSSQPAAPPNRPKQSADNSPPSSNSSKAIPKQKQPVEDDDDENWDFDEPTVKLSLSGGTSHQAQQPTSQTASTTKIKLPLNQNNQSNQQNKGDLKINNAQLSSIMTDENWEDEMDAAETPPRQQPKPRGHARVDTHVSVSSLVPNLSKYQDTADDADLGDINLDESIPAPQQQGTRRNQGTLSSKDSETSKSSPNANMSRVLHQRMKQNVNEENIDTFDDLEVDEHYFQQNETRDVDMRRSREIVQLMASIKPDSTERDVIEKCNQLLQTFEKHPEQREHLITHHGVLPVLDMLEARSGLRPNIPVLDMLEARSGTIRPHVLRVINKIVEGSIRAQEQLSLVGLIPIVMRLLEYSPNKGRLGSTEPQGVDPVVLEAGRFVHQISSTSSLTLQMLIGAGGLPVLVHMVAFSNQMCNNSTSINANDAKQMVYMGLDCIIEVFSVKSSRTRDFCKLFVKLGILPHLSLAFQYIMGMSPPASATNSQKSHLGVEPGIVTEVNRDNYEPERWQYGLRIANIFWIFSRYEVTEQMSKDGVLEVMMGALKHSSLTSPIDKFRHLYDHDEAKSIVPNEYAEIAELLLKSIKNFTMEPTALNDLEQVGAIGTLIDLLDGPIRDRCKNHILPSLYNLCRIEVRRLDSAAKEGIIPHLQRIILEGSHLKQFALPILCDLVRASHAAREELWRNDGVVFYINLLDEKYWQTFALNSLTYWLYHDSRVEGVLIEPSNVAKLVEFFRNASAQTISTILSPLSKMLSKSPPIARALGSSGLFVLSIVRRLNTSEAIVLRSLLKILQCIHQNHPSPRQLVLDHNLYSIVKALAQAEGQVVVNSIANRLLKDFQASTLT